MQDILRLGVLVTTRFTGVQCCFIGPVDLVHTFTIKQVKQLFQTSLCRGFTKGSKNGLNRAAFTLMPNVTSLSLLQCLGVFPDFSMCRNATGLSYLV